jgi:hypothetical protein
MKTFISRAKTWVGCVAHMRDRTESYKFSVGKLERTWKPTFKRRILLNGSSRNKVQTGLSSLRTGSICRPRFHKRQDTY